MELFEELLSLDYARGDGTLAELPFAAPEVKSGGAPRIVWLPAALAYRVCDSNGMAAGNTLEEALVQGLSEIFERHAEAQVLRGKAVPPRVPDEVLEATGLMPTIARIEEGGRYEVRVHDASLGRGYPVIMTSIVDRIRSSIGIKFGAHPALPVAVERTLTEAFQGRSVDDGTSTNRLASLAASADPRNISNLYINNLGVFPATAFCREPTWDFAPWPSWQGKTNTQMLSHMLEVLRRDGHHMLVRDASHLGFPSCQILVPGMSETFAPAGGLRKGLLSTIRAKEVLRRFPALSKEELRELLAIKPHGITHAHPDVFGLPFLGGKMHPCRVYGFLHLTFSEFAEAQECFAVLAQLVEGVGAYYWRAMADYAGWRADGHNEKEALRLVQLLNLPAIARRVERDVAVAREDLSTLFPQISCPDCEHCDLHAKGGCAGLTAQEETQDKIARALRHSKVTQSFPDAGDATSGLSAACARLLALGLPATVQLDVHEDGSLAGTFGLTLFFTGAHNERMSLFCPDGAADEALRQLEALGVADGRWRHAVRGSFALPVPFASKDGVLRVAGATCHPDCVKLKWTHGRLAPARFYQVVRVAPLETAASTQ